MASEHLEKEINQPVENDRGREHARVAKDLNQQNGLNDNREKLIDGLQHLQAAGTTLLSELFDATPHAEPSPTSELSSKEVNEVKSESSPSEEELEVPELSNEIEQQQETEVNQKSSLFGSLWNRAKSALGFSAEKDATPDGADTASGNSLSSWWSSITSSISNVLSPVTSFISHVSEGCRELLDTAADFVSTSATFISDTFSTVSNYLKKAGSAVAGRFFGGETHHHGTPINYTESELEKTPFDIDPKALSKTKNRSAVYLHEQQLAETPIERHLKAEEEKKKEEREDKLIEQIAQEMREEKKGKGKGEGDFEVELSQEEEARKKQVELTSANNPELSEELERYERDDLEFTEEVTNDQLLARAKREQENTQ